MRSGRRSPPPAPRSPTPSGACAPTRSGSTSRSRRARRWPISAPIPRSARARWRCRAGARPATTSPPAISSSRPIPPIAQGLTLRALRPTGTATAALSSNDRPLASPPRPLGDGGAGCRPAARRVEPAAPARPLGLHAGPARRSGVPSPHRRRRVRDRPGQLATAAGAAPRTGNRRLAGEPRALEACGRRATDGPGRRRRRALPRRSAGAGRRRRAGRVRAGVRDLAAARVGRRSRRTPGGGDRRRRRRGRRSSAPPALRAPRLGRVPPPRQEPPLARLAHLQAVRRGRPPGRPAHRDSPADGDRRARRRPRSTPGSSCATSTAPASGPTSACAPTPRDGDPAAFERRLRRALAVGARRRHARLARDRRLLSRARSVLRRRSRQPFTRSSSPTARPCPRCCRRSGARPYRRRCRRSSTRWRAGWGSIWRRATRSRVSAGGRRRPGPGSTPRRARNRTRSFDTTPAPCARRWAPRRLHPSLTRHEDARRRGRRVA